MLIGKEDGQAETYRTELDMLTGILAPEQALGQTLSNPLHDAEGRRRVLETVIGKLDLSKVMTTFLLLLKPAPPSLKTPLSKLVMQQKKPACRQLPMTLAWKWTT